LEDNASGERTSAMNMQLVSNKKKAERTCVEKCAWVLAVSVACAAMVGCPLIPIDTDDGPVEGSLIIPCNPTTLTVDGGPVSRNADLSQGSLDWYQFQGVAGQKYYILARGNAPVIVSVYVETTATDEDGEPITAATMLWTTDPEAPVDFYFYDAGKALTVAKAVHVPSFVAPATATYYVSIQAAKVHLCLDDCDNEDVDATILYTYPQPEGAQTYYEVTSYSVQVETVSGAEDAVLLATPDPATASAEELAFRDGTVTMTQSDWLYFDAAADQNYMIEFRPVDPQYDPLYDSPVYANIFAPNSAVGGAVDCLLKMCNPCCPRPFYSPVTGAFYLQVFEDNVGGAQQEWGQVDYLLRVLLDDHGNEEWSATAVDLNTGFSAPTEREGFLSSRDVDVFEFTAARLSTYLVKTEGDLDLVLGDQIGIDPLDPCALPVVIGQDIDNMVSGNEAMVVQNPNTQVARAFAAVMVDQERNTFGLLTGDYKLVIVNDDQVDNYAGNVQYANTMPVDGSEVGGALWRDDFNNLYDTDMLKFTPGKAPIWFKAGATEVNQLTVGGAVGNADLNNLPKRITLYYESVDTTNPVLVVVEGTDPDVVETQYTITLLKEDHANATGNAATDAGNATGLTLGQATPGTLWKDAGDDDIFKFAAEAHKTYKVATTEASDDTTLVAYAAAAIASDAYDLGTTKDRALAVNTGNDATDVVVQVGLAAAGANVDYNVTAYDDDYVDWVDATKPEELAKLTELSEDDPAEVTAYKNDVDLLRIAAKQGFRYQVDLTGATDDTVLFVGNVQGVAPADPEKKYDRSALYTHAGADADVVVEVQWAGSAAVNADIVGCTLTLEPDDAPDDCATAVALPVGQMLAELKSWPNDIDWFKFTAQILANKKYQISIGCNDPNGAALEFAYANYSEGDPCPTNWQLEGRNIDLLNLTAGDVVVGIRTNPLDARNENYSILVKQVDD